MACSLVHCTELLFINTGTLLKKWDTNTHSSIVNESKFCMHLLCWFTNHTEVMLSLLSQFVVSAADRNAGAYKAAMGVSLAIAIVMLLSMTVVIISVIFWHKHRGIGEETPLVDKHCITSKLHDNNNNKKEPGKVYKIIDNEIAEKTASFSSLSYTCNQTLSIQGTLHSVLSILPSHKCQ